MNDVKNTIHKAETGRYYKGIPIHACPGVHEACFELVARHLATGSSILDIAAGSGAFSLRLKDAGYNVAANDLDDHTWMVPSVPLSTVDLNQPLPQTMLSNRFDMVVAIEILEHVENPRKLLRDCCALTRNGGFVLVTAPNIADIDSRRIFLRRGCFYHFSPDAVFRTGHISPLPWWLIEAHIQAAGLELLQLTPAGGKDRTPWRQALATLVNRLLTPFIERATPDVRWNSDLLFLCKRD